MNTPFLLKMISVPRAWSGAPIQPFLPRRIRSRKPVAIGGKTSGRVIITSAKLPKKLLLPVKR